MNELVFIINNVLYNLGAFLLWFCLFKGQFKYKLSITITMYWVVIFLDVLIPSVYTPTFIIIMMIEIASNIFKAFLYKKNLVNCFALDYVSIAVVNVLGNGFIVAIAMITSLLKKDSAQWTDVDQMSISMVMLVNVTSLLGCWISYKLCKGIKDEILEAAGFLKYLFILFVTVPKIVLDILKDAVFVQYNVYPQGIIFSIEMVTLSGAVLGFTIIVFRKIMRRREANKAIIIETPMQKEVKREYTVLNESLRELSHDVNNYIALKGTSNRETIENYCDEILDGLED